MERRTFIKNSGIAGTMALLPLENPLVANTLFAKRRVALVGTGVRGISFWGKNLVDRYSDLLEFVGLADINEGRLQMAKKYMGVACPTYLDFDLMLAETKPDLLIVTTMDSTHHEFIIKGLEAGIEVITEKPLTTDHHKCQAIIDAESTAAKPIIVGFNYRWSPHSTRIKELLVDNEVGNLVSVDFNWFLNVHHGASYFRRWHGEMDKGGSLWVHKATHHFDLLNWWIDSEPVEVSAYGSLDHYGSNNEFRGANCRNCAHTDKCKFYWDITKSEHMMKLYVENEKYDGYIRDNCLWRDDIDIFDKMSAQIKYANGVLVNYSLTTYSPYEGYRIAFNGMDGRMESWEDIPWREEERINQAELHAKEMNQGPAEEDTNYHEIMLMKNFGEHEMIQVAQSKGGHGGGDVRLQDRIFKNRSAPDPLKHTAGSRDGAMSILIGIAARQSIAENRPVRIDELTSLEPQAIRS